MENVQFSDSANQKIVRGSFPEFRAQAFEYAGIGFSQAEQLIEMEDYWRLALSAMLTPRYGLIHEDYLSSDIRDYQNHTVFLARDLKTGQLLGALRLVRNFSIEPFSNLDQKFFHSLGSEELVEKSVYYAKEVKGPLKLTLWEGLMSLMVQFCLKNEIQAVYAEMLPEQRETFEKFGYRVVGEKFQVPGWTQSWFPIVLKVQSVASQFEDLDFQKRWLKETNVRLNVEFWRRLLSFTPITLEDMRIRRGAIREEQFETKLSLDNRDIRSSGLSSSFWQVELLEKAFSQWIHSKGAPYAELQKRGFFLRVREAKVEYVKPLQTKEPLKVQLHVQNQKGSSQLKVNASILMNGQKITQAQILYTCGLSDDAQAEGEGQSCAPPDYWFSYRP